MKGVLYAISKHYQRKCIQYNSKTKPVADYYAAQGKQKVIDGLGAIEAIAARIKEAIG